MKLNMACSGQRGHKEFVRKHKGLRPTVISAKRFEGIMSRSRQDERREVLAAVEEEQKYKKYLKDGSDALCAQFTNYSNHEAKDENTLQENRDKLLMEKTKDQKAKQLLEELRKERIMRANKMLHLMKAGPRALQQALVESEMIKQRKYNDAVNKEIAQEAKQQTILQDQQCPEVLIPFSPHKSEEQEKAEQVKKTLAIRDNFLKDMEERSQRKVINRNKEIFEAVIQREYCKMLKEDEDKAARDLKARKREFCRKAYKDALREKAEKAKFENICDQIDDRIRCVNQVAQRNLSNRYNKQVLEMRANQIQNREARAIQICRLQQEKKREEENKQTNREECYQAAADDDEIMRKCHQEELSKQRRAYQLEERKQDEENKLKNAEVRRFEMARRFRNAEANKHYSDIEKKRKDNQTKDLREVLHGQRQEFLQQRQDELMRVAACQDDPSLQDDVMFFDEAANIMQESKEIGRPLYPLAKVVETYKRDNKIDMRPEGQMICRNTTRDICWPGYYSKAQLAYRKYEHVEKCRQENAKQRQGIFDNCLKITKMAAAENPFRPCVQSGTIKCLKYKEMPVIDSVHFLDKKCLDTDTIKSKQSKRNVGGFDLPAEKHDGISRSHVGIVSTKQKRSSNLPNAELHYKESLESCGFVANKTETQPEECIDTNTVKTKESPPSTTSQTNLDLLTEKRDGMSRSEIGIVSTKQKRSSKQPNLEFHPRESLQSIGSVRGSGVIPRSFNVTKSVTKLPDLNQYLTAKPQCVLNDLSQSNSPRKVSKRVELSLVKDNASNSSLPDLTPYLVSKRLTQSTKAFGVAELLAPDQISDRVSSLKLPDLTQYWTPKLEAQQKSEQNHK